MIAGHRQGAARNHPILAAQCDVEMRDTLDVMQAHRTHIGLRVETICHHAAIRDAPNQCLHLGMVGAADREPVKGDIRDEIVKAFAQIFDCAPMFHVFGVDICDDGDGGG